MSHDGPSAPPVRADAPEAVPVPVPTPAPEALAAPSVATAPRDRTVAVTGASGFVGRVLCEVLVASGHRVIALTRSPALAAPAPDRPSPAQSGNGAATPVRAQPAVSVRWRAYDPLDERSVAAAIAGTDAVVNLAGENLFGKRWKRAFMEAIRSSRVDTTRVLVAAMKSLPRPPAVLASVSAVGYYGPRDPAEDVTEASAAGSDFLAEVCKAWEAEASQAQAAGIRTVILRLGVVVGPDGGALSKMVGPFKKFVGGPIGSGKQAFAWVHLDDVIGLLVAAVEDDRWRGPVNAVSPGLCTNREFSKALGRALHRPCWLPVPRFALRIVLGRVASVLTTGQRVLPTAATRLGYRFRFPEVVAALTDALRR